MEAGNPIGIVVASIIISGAFAGCFDANVESGESAARTEAGFALERAVPVFGGGRGLPASIVTPINLTNVVRIAGEFETGGWVMYRFNLTEPETWVGYRIREQFESLAGDGEDHFIFFAEPRFVHEGYAPFGISNFLIGNASRLTSDSNWSVSSSQSGSRSELVAFIATDAPMRFTFTLRFGDDDVEGDVVDALPFAHGSGTRVLATHSHDPVAPGVKLHAGMDEIAAESNETGIQFFAVDVKTAPVIRHTSRLVKIRDFEVVFSNGASHASTDVGVGSDPRSGFAVPRAPPGHFDGAFRFLDASTRLRIIAGFIPANLEVLIPGIDLENVFHPWVDAEEDAYVDPWSAQRVTGAHARETRTHWSAD